MLTRELPWELLPSTRVQRRRWLWPALSVTAFFTLTAWVLRRDPPAPGIQARTWLTLATAALVAGLLGLRRAEGGRQLTRALLEYTAVTVLVVALTTPTHPTRHHPPAPAMAAPSTTTPAGMRAVQTPTANPGMLIQLRDQLVRIWRDATRQAATPTPPPTTTPRRR
jgi:hypothetical protein